MLMRCNIAAATVAAWLLWAPVSGQDLFLEAPSHRKSGGGSCSEDAFKQNTGSSGNKIAIVAAADALACCAACGTTDGCSFWTLNTVSNKCLLKSGKATFSNENGRVSGMGPPAPAPPPAPPQPLPSKNAPNFVLLLVDDQDILLDSMEHHEGVGALETVTSVVRDGGATLRQFVAHTPVCCPSRSEMFSGRYFHNIRGSSPEKATNDCMHVNATLDDFESHTMASYLWQQGYATGMFGKYLNDGGMKGICPSKKTSDGSVPFGWDRFFAMCPDTCYEDCVFSDQGTWVKRDDPNAPGSNYATSVMANESLAWLEEIHSNGDERPFFLYLGPHAPHGPATPAPWYSGKVWSDKTKAPRTPSYNVSSPDKNWMVSTQPVITEHDEAHFDSFYRDRLRSLLSVDDAFAGVHALLEKQGRSDNTYYIYTSDHGLHMGQFRLGACKRTVYETDLRVPFFISGPGIPAGSIYDDLVGHPDLAPTVLALAGAGMVDRHDGRSFAHILNPNFATPAGYAPREAYLVEYYATSMSGVSTGGGHIKDAPNNTFIALRLNTSDEVLRQVGSGELLYAEYTDVHDWQFSLGGPGEFYELYDLRADPHQLHNLHSSQSDVVRDALHQKLRAAWRCQGTKGNAACV